MSIEQTDQLILLIMNSALMTLLSSGLLGGIWLRQHSLLQQLSEVRSHYHQLTRQDATAHPDHPINQPAGTHALKQLRAKRARLQQQYQWSRVGTTMMHGAVLVFSISLFVLALRSLLNFNHLIPAALCLFTLGAAGVLAGISCVLVDFASDRSSGYSLGQTFAQLFQQLGQQWQRKHIGGSEASLSSGSTQERSV